MTAGGKKKYLEETAVLWNHRVGPEYFHMGIACRTSFKEAVPGQFVMIRLKSQTMPLLRRPFSIHDLIHSGSRISGFEILYKVVGQGTEKLAGCRAGDTIDILGPLGKGFSLYDDRDLIYMAAGGIGIAPFVFLTKVLLAKGVDGSRVMLFLGGRSGSDLLSRQYFEQAGIHLRFATDDGSVGTKGPVTVPLASAMREKKPGILYACGPVPMLKAVMDLATAMDTRCEISIETVMACGMGACLGCAVENRNPAKKYFHACMDGPVFDARQVIL